MTILNNIKRIRSVTKALDAVRGELGKKLGIAIIAEPLVEAEILKKLQYRGEDGIIFGLNSLPTEKEKEARLRGTDLAVVVISPGQAKEELLSVVRRASLAKTRLVVVTGREIDDWLVENLAEVFKVSGEDVAFVPFSDQTVVRTILVPKIVDKMAKKEVALAAKLPVFKEEVAKRIISETAKQNAVIGIVVFIPGADMPLMTLNQIKMVIRLAAVYNQELSIKRLNEILATIGGGFAFREVARQLLGFVPVAGWAVKGGIAYGGTVVVGRLAKKYFEHEKGEIIESLAADTADIKQGREAKPIHKS